MTKKPESFKVSEEHVLSAKALSAEKAMKNTINDLVRENSEELYSDCKKILDYLKSHEKKKISFFNRKVDPSSPAPNFADFLNAVSNLDQKISNVLQVNNLLDPYANSMLYTELFKNYYDKNSNLTLIKPKLNEANIIHKVKFLLNDITDVSNMDKLIEAQSEIIKNDFANELSDHMLLHVSQLSSILQNLHPAISGLTAEESQAVESEIPMEDQSGKITLSHLSQYLTLKNESYVKDEKSISNFALPESKDASNLFSLSSLKNIHSLINNYNYHIYNLSNTSVDDNQLLTSLKFLTEIKEKIENNIDIDEPTLLRQVERAHNELCALFDIKSYELSSSDELHSKSSNDYSSDSDEVSENNRFRK